MITLGGKKICWNGSSTGASAHQVLQAALCIVLLMWMKLQLVAPRWEIKPTIERDLANIGTQITPPFPTMQFLKRGERFSPSENNAPLEQGQPPPASVCARPRAHVHARVCSSQSDQCRKVTAKLSPGLDFPWRCNIISCGNFLTISFSISCSCN